MLEHLLLYGIPKIFGGHRVDSCIAQDGKLMILYSQVKKDPVSLFGFMHFQFRKPPCSPVHHIFFAMVVDVHPDLS